MIYLNWIEVRKTPQTWQHRPSVILESILFLFTPFTVMTFLISKQWIIRTKTLLLSDKKKKTFLLIYGDCGQMEWVVLFQVSIWRLQDTLDRKLRLTISFLKKTALNSEKQSEGLNAITYIMYQLWNRLSLSSRIKHLPSRKPSGMTFSVGSSTVFSPFCIIRQFWSSANYYTF